jgi:hypothetical protein
VLLRVRRLLSGAHAGHFVPQRPRALIVGGIILLILLLGVARIPCGTGWTLSARWTAWPPWSAELLDVFGIRVRDYPLDVHRYEPQRLTE